MTFCVVQNRSKKLNSYLLTRSFFSKTLSTDNNYAVRKAARVLHGQQIRFVPSQQFCLDV